MIARAWAPSPSSTVGHLAIGPALAIAPGMRAHVELDLNPGERSALKNLTPEEREAVIDELLAQAREDLEWVVARAAVEELAATRPTPSPRPVTPPPLPAQRTTVRTRPVRRQPPRSWINR